MNTGELETLLEKAFRSNDQNVRRVLEYTLETLTNNERAAVYLTYGEVPPQPLDKELSRVAPRAFGKLARSGRADGLAQLELALGMKNGRVIKTIAQKVTAAVGALSDEQLQRKMNWFLDQRLQELAQIVSDSDAGVIARVKASLDAQDQDRFERYLRTPKLADERTSFFDWLMIATFDEESLQRMYGAR